MLGENIAKLRRQHKLSQYDLADRLGFSRGKLANYEQGSRQPDFDTLKKIADYFEVSTDYLLGRTEDTTIYKQILTTNYDKEIEKLLEDPELGLWYKELMDSPEENRQQALDFLRYLNEQESDRKPKSNK